MSGEKGSEAILCLLLMSMSGGVKTNSTLEASGNLLSTEDKPDPRYSQETTVQAGAVPRGM